MRDPRKNAPPVGQRVLLPGTQRMMTISELASDSTSQASAEFYCTTVGDRAPPSHVQKPSIDASERWAIAGASDHAATQALHGRGPGGIQFQITWLEPDVELERVMAPGIEPTRTPDIDTEIDRYGATTPGGPRNDLESMMRISASCPVAHAVSDRVTDCMINAGIEAKINACSIELTQRMATSTAMLNGTMDMTK